MVEVEPLGEALRTFYGRTSRAMSRAMANRGLSLARAKLLILLQREGPLRSADIADFFGYSPRTVTEGVDALERDGFVRRDPDPDDRRAKRISITAEGIATIETVGPVRQEFQEFVFGSLNEAERETLSTLLDKLNHRLEEWRPSR